MKQKKALILGATGAMAVYLIPLLAKQGYQVDGVSPDEKQSNDKNVRYICADAKNIPFLKELLENHYDVIVDFMVYNTAGSFQLYYPLFLEHTKHYIFLSTYRVYADDAPLSETSKRLWDIERPDDFVTELEYSVYKAQEEDLLLRSPYSNYTILRPAVTYSKKRFQLTVLEWDVLVYRMFQNKTVVLPQSAMEKQATMTWAGDVAKMIAAIALNSEAFGQIYNVSTSEHMTWREVAEIYREIGGLKYITTDDETFLDIFAKGAVSARQQLLYDRCFDRIVDNEKILKLCHMKQSDLMPLKEGLKTELGHLKPSEIACNREMNQRMDEYLKTLCL